MMDSCNKILGPLAAGGIFSLKMIHGTVPHYAEDEDDSEPSLDEEDELLDDELNSPPLLLLSPGWATSPGSRRG